MFVPSRLLAALYLVSVALVPWTWFPPFPWLHAHAQWSDAVFACAAVVWVVERARAKDLRLLLRAPFASAALYFACAAGSLATHGLHGAAPAKLLGIGELCALLIVSADLTSTPRIAAGLGRVVACNAVLVGALAVIGLLLFYAGVGTALVGTYGDLLPSPYYARMQVGAFHPNLLASYSIFAAAVVAAPQSALPTRLRRIAGVALWITMVLSFSRASIGFAYAALLRWALAGRAGPRRYAAIAVGVPALGFLALLTRYNLLLDPTHWWSARFVEPDVQGRWINIPSSLQQVASHPSWGCGLDCLPVELEDGYRQDTHLTWLNIAATLGLPALAAFVAVVVSTWRTRRKPTNVALWSGLVGLFFDSLACDVENFRHVWLLLGCLNARPELMPGLTKRPTADHHVASSPT